MKGRVQGRSPVEVHVEEVCRPVGEHPNRAICTLEPPDDAGEDRGEDLYATDGRHQTEKVLAQRQGWGHKPQVEVDGGSRVKSPGGKKGAAEESRRERIPGSAAQLRREKEPVRRDSEEEAGRTIRHEVETREAPHIVVHRLGRPVAHDSAYLHGRDAHAREREGCRAEVLRVDYLVIAGEHVGRGRAPRGDPVRADVRFRGTCGPRRAWRRRWSRSEPLGTRMVW